VCHPLDASTTRAANLVLQPSEHIKRELTPEQVERMRPEQYAALLFHVGTLNLEWDKLAGPCARCGNYYIRSAHRKMSIAPADAGMQHTAVARTRERIKAEHDDKMEPRENGNKGMETRENSTGLETLGPQKTGIDLRFRDPQFHRNRGSEIYQKGEVNHEHLSTKK